MSERGVQFNPKVNSALLPADEGSVPGLSPGESSNMKWHVDLRVETSVAVGERAARCGLVRDEVRHLKKRRTEICLLPTCFGWHSAVSAILFVSLFLTVPGLAALAKSPPSAPESAAKLRVITTAREAHNLTAEEARRAYPVHLRAVVTYFDPGNGHGHPSLFVHDSTGSIFLKVPSNSIKSLPSGTLVDVQGVSNLGQFAPIVDQPQIRVIGHSALPAAGPRVSRTDLFSGRYDGQWVEVEGVVRSVFESSH